MSLRLTGKEYLDVCKVDWEGKDFFKNDKKKGKPRF